MNHNFARFLSILFLAGLSPALCAADRFELRARVLKVKGEVPDDLAEFTIGYGGLSTKTSASDWSAWLPCSELTWNKLRRDYPNNGRVNPMVFWLRFQGIEDTSIVEAEARFPGKSKIVYRMPGELFGQGMGLAVYKEGEEDKLASFAQYNRRFWAGLKEVEIPLSERPKKFPIVDSLRTRGGTNRLTFREGFSALAGAGFNVLGPEVHKPQVREELERVGITRTGGGTFTAPGWVCNYGPESEVDKVLSVWARKQADAFRASGWSPEQVASFAIIDEPHWSMPGHLKGMRESEDGMKRFHAFLRSQGLAPKDLGAKEWSEVQPASKGVAVDLPGKRLFYWTARFAAADSCRHLNLVTRKMEEAFYPGIGVFANWNNFKGRFYVPRGGDSATMHHDWIEFGRLRGANVLWTEDWYASGWQWPYWCAKLSAGARKGGIRYGGYVVPRSYGDNNAIIQSILSLVGNGGKVLQYFIFGPEYIFPSNCYSYKADKLLPRMARAHHMIGKAEDVLWPGQRPRSEVAMLFPVSPQVWDQPGVFEATNTLVYFKTMSYMGEIFSQFFSLLRHNVPVDFVEELDLTPKGLEPYKVLYVTSPNVPREHQANVAEWVRKGGTLVTCYGSMTADRYNEPCDVFSKSSGIRQKEFKRPIAYKVFSLKRLKGPDPKNPWPKGEHGEFCMIGYKAGVDAEGAMVLGRFLDGSPAIVQKDFGRGRILHFAFFPGMSYWGNQFSRMSEWMLLPAKLAGVKPPIEVEWIPDSWPQVEAPLLLSDEGAAITLINRTGKPRDEFRVTARLPFEAASVESVGQGRLPFSKTKDGRISFTLPLDVAADVVGIKPKVP